MTDGGDVERLADEIQAGRDDIEVPAELVEERPPEPPRNLAARIAAMTVGERLKLALKGNRDARAILIRDSSRLVQRFVLQNPRITEEEVIAVAKNRSIDRELLELIARNREWVQNYLVRLGLVTNPKTPAAIALRFVGTLSERDLRLLAKSKNVPTLVSSAAKRLVMRR